MPSFLDFKKLIAEFEGKIEKLHHLSDGGVFNIANEVGLPPISGPALKLEFGAV